jgi:glycosyltransferase involved in cell wall biosynthesis
MRLGIISDCIHYKLPDGRVATENHILLRQFKALCSNFSESTICCPFAEFNSSKVLSTYAADNIRFIPLPVVGGDTLKAKAKLLSTIPKWLKVFQTIDENSDIVYQRFPNNLNIPGFFYFLLKRKKVFATYTGTWHNHVGEPATYRFQRWLLTKFFKGPVWVYTDKTLANKRIFAGFSPSYSLEEWEEEIDQVEERIKQIELNGLPHFHLISVGTLATHKNHAAIIEACAILKEKNFSFNLTIVGDGPLRGMLQDLIIARSLQNEVMLAGKKRSDELRELYRQHDFVVQAPLAEGFGKVPIEGFFHGVVPVINNVSMAFSITGNGERGFLFDEAVPQKIADTIIMIKDRVNTLPQMIIKGREYAKKQTLKAWADEYYTTVKEYFEEA